MSNFSFLKTEFPQLYKSAYLAEQRIRTEPVTAGFHARLALEMTVKEIYHLENLDWPHDTGLYSLMTQEDFKALETMRPTKARCPLKMPSEPSSICTDLSSGLPIPIPIPF
jgi:hypothetical protein